VFLLVVYTGKVRWIFVGETDCSKVHTSAFTFALCANELIKLTPCLSLESSFLNFYTCKTTLFHVIFLSLTFVSVSKVFKAMDNKAASNKALSSKSTFYQHFMSCFWIASCYNMIFSLKIQHKCWIVTFLPNICT